MQRIGRRRKAGSACRRRCAGAPVGTGVSEKVAFALEAQAERRRDHCMAYHGHVVQRVVEAKREADHQQRGADLDSVGLAGEVIRCEGTVHGSIG